jgi:hypothetical protein
MSEALHQKLYIEVDRCADRYINVYSYISIYLSIQRIELNSEQQYRFFLVLLGYSQVREEKQNKMKEYFK